jgi:hypothetical protein
MGVVRRGTTYTAIMEASSRSPILADETEREADFNSWGEFLKDMSVPSSHICAIAWTTTAAPVDPAEMAKWVEQNRRVPSSHLVAQTMDELVAMDAGSVRHQINLALQIDRSRFATAKAIKHSGGGDEGACRVLSHVLSGARSKLRSQGKITRVLSPSEVRGTVRCRFDPSRVPLLGGNSSVLEPIGDDRGRNYNYYLADGHFHITGRAVRLPDEAEGVRLGFLEPLLLFPSYQRTVSCVLEVPPSHEARRYVRGLKLGRSIESTIRSKVDAWETPESEKSEAAPSNIAYELSNGAALVKPYIYASVTAPTLEQAEEHYGYLESDAFTAGIELGRRYGDQRNSFCATLPLGRVA